MKIRNTALYDKLKGCIEDACKDSLSWRPHTVKYRTLVESILAEEVVCRNIEWWAPDTPAADEAAAWLSHFLEGFQEETQNGLVWNAKAFDLVFSRLEEFLYEDTYVSHFVSPLKSFSYDLSTPIELETGVYVRKQDNLLSSILRNQGSSVGYPPDEADWVVDILVEQPKSVEREIGDSHTTRANEKLRAVLQSLRLLHQGRVFVGPLYYLVYPDFAGFRRNVGILLDSGLTMLPRAHPSYFTLAEYHLGKQEVEDLKSLYTSATREARRFPASFALALSRFHDYFGRVNEVDGFLDLVIALEALFAGGSQEIGYSLALRCSLFLESDIQERGAVFGRLRDIYGIRSSVVHGQPDPPRKWRRLRGEDRDLAFALIVADAEEYVRRAIRKIIVDGHLDRFQDSAQWVKFLDHMILRGGI